jgi:hypothetical protein
VNKLVNKIERDKMDQEKARVALMMDVFIWSMTDRKTGDLIVSKDGTEYKETKRGRVREVGGSGKAGVKKKETQIYVKKLIDRKGKERPDGFVAIEGMYNDMLVAVQDDVVNLIVACIETYADKYKDEEDKVKEEVVEFLAALKTGKIRDLGEMQKVMDKGTDDTYFLAQVITPIERVWNEIGYRKPELNVKQVATRVEKKIKI